MNWIVSPIDFMSVGKKNKKKNKKKKKDCNGCFIKSFCHCHGSVNLTCNTLKVDL